MTTDLLDPPAATLAAAPPEPDPPLMTAEEFFAMPADGKYYELVRGELEEVCIPAILHGDVQLTIGVSLRAWLKENDVGRAFGEAGVVVERGPDTVRGPDIVFYSYERYPRGTPRQGFTENPPEVAFEIRSPGDRRTRLLRKVAEYLDAGVVAVLSVDPERRTAELFTGEGPTVNFAAGDRLALPAPLDGWNPTVAELVDEQ